MTLYKMKSELIHSAAPRLHCGLLAVFTILLATTVVGGTALHAADTPKKAAPTAAAKTQAANPADFVGSEACSTCHDEVAKGFETSPHKKMAMLHGGTGQTCESCHGPGKAHVESGGDKTKIFRFTTASAKDIDDKCLECHQGTHANFERSAHGEANVSCVNCHGVHKSAEQTRLLKVSAPTLCYGCHTDIKPDFSKPFHHKVDEGLMNCNDCHDPHGTFQKKGLKTAANGDQVCVKCHTETAGPFVFQHPPVKTEGCTSCHSPHGSPNPRLLNRSNVNTLCLQCHTGGTFTAPGVPSFHNQAAQYQACTICHTQVHGSNSNPFFFK